MKKLTELYQAYFKVTTESFNIGNDRKHWPVGMNYAGMVTRENQIHFEVAKLRAEITRLESLLENSY